MRGCDVGGNPCTTGAANCIAVCWRMRTTKSRISLHFARSRSDWFAPGGGKARHMACSLAIGPTSCLAASGVSSSSDQIMARYFALTFAFAAMPARVTLGFPRTERCLKRQAVWK